MSLRSILRGSSAVFFSDDRHCNFTEIWLHRTLLDNRMTANFEHCVYIKILNVDENIKITMATFIPDL